jgi:hypothetical protein
MAVELPTRYLNRDSFASIRVHSRFETFSAVGIASPNQAASGNGVVASLFHAALCRRAVPEMQHWAEYSQARTRSKWVQNCGCFAPFAGALVPQRRGKERGTKPQMNTDGHRYRAGFICVHLRPSVVTLFQNSDEMPNKSPRTRGRPQGLRWQEIKQSAREGVPLAPRATIRLRPDLVSPSRRIGTAPAEGWFTCDAIPMYP